MTNKVRFLEKDAFDRDGFKKTLEEKILKLEAVLSKSSLTFKKYEASASTFEKVWLNQKHSWDTHGIGYETKPISQRKTNTTSPSNLVLKKGIIHLTSFLFVTTVV